MRPKSKQILVEFGFLPHHDLFSDEALPLLRAWARVAALW
jgi:hypothetical protein